MRVDLEETRKGARLTSRVSSGKKTPGGVQNHPRGIEKQTEEFDNTKTEGLKYKRICISKVVRGSEREVQNRDLKVKVGGWGS